MSIKLYWVTPGLLKYNHKPDIPPEKVVESLSKYIDIDVEYILLGSKKKPYLGARKREIMDFRFMLYSLLCKHSLPHYTLKELGQAVGGRDHSTVINGKRGFNNLYNTNKEFKLSYNIIEFKVNQDLQNKTNE